MIKPKKYNSTDRFRLAAKAKQKYAIILTYLLIAFTR